MMKIPFEPVAGDEPYAYVSYAHKDAQEVFEDLKKFNDLGVNIFYNVGLSTGLDWEEQLAEKITNSSLFVVFISSNSIEAKFVRQELFMALNSNIPILPIYMEDAELKYGLKLVLGNIQSIFKFSMPEEQYIELCMRMFKEYSVVD